MVSLNVQPPEKQTFIPSGMLDVVDVFYTIQGEGPFAGEPAVFVRLAGCNLQCQMCDTDYTSNRAVIHPTDLYARVLRSYADAGPKPSGRRPLIVLTGGEPFRQNFGPFARIAVGNQHRVQVETNGTLWNSDIPWSDVLFSIVVSPKTPAINNEIARLAAAWKYVLQWDEIDPKDGLPTSVLDNNLTPCRPYGGHGRWNVYVQPADFGDPHLNQANVKAAIVSCLKHGYKMSVQIHKILGLA